MGPKGTGRKQELQARRVRSYVFARPAEATGQPWFARYRAGSRCFASQMHDGLIWGKFASL